MLCLLHGAESSLFSASQEIRAFCGTRRFISAFTSARSLPVPTLSQIYPVHAHLSHCLKIHLIILPSSTPGSFKWSLSLRFPHQNPVYASPPHTCYMPRPSHSSRFGHPNNKWVRNNTSLSSSSCSFLRSPVTSSLLGPYILLSTLFSNTLSLRASLNVSDQVSHPLQNKRENYSSVYLNLYIFR